MESAIFWDVTPYTLVPVRLISEERFEDEDSSFLRNAINCQTARSYITEYSVLHLLG
jgi:hypothetical protein